MITVSVVGDEVRIHRGGALVTVLDRQEVFRANSDGRIPHCPTRPLFLTAEDALDALSALR